VTAASTCAYPPQFYRASEFKLHRQRAFPFADDLLLSQNYFNVRRWWR
jgi:hypothetical protein